MRIAVLSLVITMTIASTLAAQTALFVNSAPIDAEVTINGAAYGTTPLLVRDLAPGTYEVSFFKRGHSPATDRVDLDGDEARAVELTLEPDAFIGAFSAKQTIVDGRVYPRRDSTFRLPSGTYELVPDGSSMRLSPVYPNEGALRAARIATIAGGFAAAISTVEDLLVRDGQSYFTSFLPSPATITMWTITAGAGGFWIALASEKRAYHNRTVVQPYGESLTAAEAERFYLNGEEALEAGNLSRALNHYTRVVAEGGDSEYVPDALYKSAQIYSVSGDVELASRLLEELVSELPAPDVYDRGLKSLADAYVAMERYDNALATLGEMVYYDSTYAPADIEAEVEQINRAREEDAQ